MTSNASGNPPGVIHKDTLGVKQYKNRKVEISEFLIPCIARFCSECQKENCEKLFPWLSQKNS